MALPKTQDLETMNVSEARKQFSDLLNRVHRDEELIVVEKSGIPMAGIVPMSVVRAAQEKEAQRQEFLQVLNTTRSGFVNVSEEEIEREIEKALAEIKQERLFARRIVAAINRISPDAFESSDEHLETTVARILTDEARQKAAGEKTLAANAS
ncbi:MAG: type II toxin-antitoxin system Phd/YefM family antitoxin [Chloroflexia bacterium]|nr:type II toxin-antitoxin system Phd/YefM family antitoxin [Chloroflexia bacterium]